MRVKKHNDVAGWNFILIDPAGVETTVPSGLGAPKLATLIRMVISLINVYDNATDKEYSKEQREFAKEKGMDFDRYMARVIEHQFCLRKSPAIPCWNDGAGDIIHNALSAVDGYVEKTPEVIRRNVEKMVRKITPSKSKTFRGCSACGGSIVFNPRIDNLGRAGKLNR